MAIQQVGGRGVYVITGSGRDPRKTSNGQSWADLVTKQRYMLYKSAYDQAMREYKSGAISNKEKEKRIKDMRKSLQNESDDLQSAMNQLERDELKANEVRERNKQKYDAETSLVTTSTPSSRSSRQSKIPNKQQYEQDLQEQKRKINKDNQILQRQQDYLATSITRLGAMSRSGSGALQKVAAPKDQQEQEYNDIFDEIQRNRLTTGKINTELDLIGDKTNPEFAVYYQKNRAPIQESGSVSQGSTSSKYRTRPIMELDPVDYSPEMQAKQKRLNELKAEMDALQVDLDDPIDVIDRTREIYSDKYGRGFRRGGAQQPARQPVQQPARQPVQQPVQQPASQEIQALVQDPDEQPVQQTVQTQVSDPFIRRNQKPTPNRTAEYGALEFEDEGSSPYEYNSQGDQDEFENEFQNSSPVVQEDIYTDMGEEVSYALDRVQDEKIAKERFAMPQTYSQPFGTVEKYEPVTDMGTEVSSPMTEALERIERERQLRQHLAQVAGEDEFQFQAQAEPSEVNFQPSTPEVVEPRIQPQYGRRPVPTEIGDKLREIYPTEEEIYTDMGEEVSYASDPIQEEQRNPFSSFYSTPEQQAELKNMNDARMFVGSGLDQRVRKDGTWVVPSPTPTPIPQQLQRLDRIPLFNKKLPVTEQPLTASKLVSQAFDEVRNLSTEDKQRVARELLEKAKNQFGVTSKEYKKAKTVIFKELAKAIDPKKAQQMQKVKKLQQNNPSQYYKMGDNINGLSKDTKMLVQSLFAVDNDTKLSEIESLYQNAEQQIKMRVENKTQKTKALEMLELMYLAVIQDNR